MLTGRLSGGSIVTSRPRSTIRPPVGSSKPPIIRRVVVLPQPDGPRSEKNSPAPISSDTSSTARTSRKCFARSTRRISATGAVGDDGHRSRSLRSASRGRGAGRPGVRNGPRSSVPSPSRDRVAMRASAPSQSGSRRRRLLEVERDRRVVRRDRRALARLAIDLGLDDPGRHVRADEQQVDAHPEVLVEHAGPVVPPREAAGLVVAESVAIDEPAVEQRRNAARSGSETWVPPWAARGSHTSTSVGATL